MRGALVVWLMLAGLGAWSTAHASSVTKEKLQAVYADGALYVDAKLDVRLSTEVEEALKTGIPLYFVAHAKLTEKRWYWYDKEVVERYRTARLSYVPLTRRWQLRSVEGRAVSQDDGAFADARSRGFASLDEALDAVESFGRWKIADVPARALDGDQYVQFDFELDLSSLPKAFQIGAGAGSNWEVQYSAKTWPQHEFSAALTPEQDKVVAQPVEITSRSKGGQLHTQSADSARLSESQQNSLPAAPKGLQVTPVPLRPAITPAVIKPTVTPQATPPVGANATPSVTVTDAPDAKKSDADE